MLAAVSDAYFRADAEREQLEHSLALSSQELQQANTILDALNDITRAAVETERHQRQLAEALRDVGAALTATLDVNSLLDRLLAEMERIVPYDSANIMLLDAERSVARVVRHRGYDRFGPATVAKVESLEFALAHAPILRQMLATGEPVRIANVPSDTDWVVTASSQHIGSWVSVPISVQGEVIAFLAADKVEPDFYQPEHLERLRGFAGQAALALHNARLFEALRQQTAELEVIREVNLSLTSTLDLRQVFDAILQTAFRVIPMAQDSHMFLYDGARLSFGAARWFEQRVDSPYREPRPDGVTATVARSGQAEVIPDMRRHPLTSEWDGALVSLPLRIGARVVGVMNVACAQPRAFSESELRILRSLGDQAAIAIENARLFGAAEKRAAELEAVRQMSLSLTSNLELREVFDVILRHVLKLASDVHNVHLYLYHGGRLNFGAARWADGREGNLYTEPRPQGLTYTVAESGHAVAIPNLQTHPLFAGTGRAPQGALVGLPLRFGSRVVGVLNVAYTHPRQFDETELRLLSLVTDQAASAIEGARLFEATRRQLQELTALHAIATAGAEATSEDALIERATELIGETLYPSNFGVILVDDLTGDLRVHPSYRDKLDPAHPRLIPAGQGISGRVVAAAQSLRIGDVAEFSGYFVGSIYTRSELCVPFAVGGRVIGVINAESDKPQAFTESDERLLITFAGQLGTAIEKMRLFDTERRRSAQLRIAHELALALTIVMDSDEAARIVAQKLADEFHYALVSILMLNEAEQCLESRVVGGPEAQRVTLPYRQALDRGVSGRAARLRQPMLVNNVATDPDYFELAGWQIGSELCIPLMRDGQVIAVLNADALQANAFSDYDVVLLQVAGRELLHAWERIQLFGAEREQRERAETLRDVASALNAVLDREQMLTIILEQLARVVSYDSAAVMLLDSDTLTIIAHRGFRADAQIHIPYHLDTLAHIRQVLETRHPVIIPDTAADPRWHYVPGTNYIRCWLGVPLVAKERVIGLLNLDKENAGFYTERHAELAVAVANQAAVALERLRLLEEAQQREKEMAALLRVAQVASSTLNLDDLMTQVAMVMAQALTVERCEIETYDADRQEVVTRALYTATPQFTSDELGRVWSLAEFPAVRHAIDADETLIVHVTDESADPAELRLLRGAGAATEWVFPIRSGGRVVGLVELATANAERQFTPAELRLARALGDQVGVAIENVRLFQAERDQRELAEVLREVGTILGATLDVDAILDRLLEQVTRVAPCDAANVMLVENQQGRFARLRGYERFGADVPRELAALTFDLAATPNLRHMTATGRPLIIPDTSADPHWAATAANPHLRSWAGAPIVLQSEGVVAFFSLEKVEANFYRAEHAERLAAFAAQAALALQNARLFATQQQRAAELEAVRQTSLSLTSSLELPVVLQAILKGAFQQVSGAQDAYIFLYHPEGERLTFGATLWAQDRASADWEEPRPDELTYAVARTGEMVTVSHARDYPWATSAPVEWGGAIIGLPLKIGQRVVGVMNLAFAHSRDFPESELRVLRLLGDQAAIAIENARLFEEAQRKTQALGSLYTTILAIGSVLDTEVLLARLHEQVQRLLAADTFAVILHHPASEEIEVALLVEYGQRLPVVRLPITQGGFSSWVITTRKPMLVGDVQVNPLPIETQYLIRPPRAWLGVPLIARDKILGVVFVQSDKPHAFGEADQQFLEAISGQVAIALENAQLYAETQRRLVEQTLLYECTQDLLTTHDLDAAIAAVSARLVTYLGVTGMTYYSYDEIAEAIRADYEYFAPQSAIPERESLLGQTWALSDYPRLKQVLKTFTPVVMRRSDIDLTQLERENFLHWGIQTSVSIPVALQGRAVGYFEIWDSRAERQYREADLRLLTTVATQAAAAIQNATLYAEVRAKATELTRLYAAAQDMGASLEPHVVLDQLARHLTEALEATSGYITEVNWEEETFSILSEYWSEAAAPAERVSDLGRVYFMPDYPTTSQTLAWGDIKSYTVESPELAELERKELLEYGVKSALLVPITSRGRVFGQAEIWDSRRLRHFTPAEHRLAQMLVRQAAGVIENAQLFKALASEKRRLELLYTLSQSLAASLDPPEIAAKALALIGVAFAALKGSVFILQPDTDQLRLLAAIGCDEAQVQELDRQMNFRIGDGLAGWAVTQRRAVIAVDVTRDPHWVSVPGLDDGARAAIALPLIAGEQVIGVFGLNSDRLGAFLAEQIPLLTAATSSVAAALQNARLFEAEARRARDQALLNEITRAAIETPDLRAMLQKLSDRLSELLKADASYVTLWDEQRQMPVPLAASGPQRETYPTLRPDPDEVTLTGSVLSIGRLLVVEDVFNSPFISQRAAQLSGASSMLGLPLITADRKLGAVIIAYAQTHHFTADEMARAEQAAAQIALGIEKSRLFAETIEALAREQRLNEVARAISGALDAQAIIENVVRLALELVGAEAGSMALVTADGNVLKIAHTFNMPTDLSPQDIPQGQGVAWQIITTRRPLLLEDYPAHPSALPEWVAAGARGFIGVPVVAGEACLGVLGLFSLHPTRRFNERDLAVVEAVGRQAGVAIQNARLFEATRHYADEVIAASDILRTLNATPEIAQAFPAIVAGVKAITLCDRVSLGLLDETRESFNIVAISPYLETALGNSVRLAHTAASADLLAGRPHLSPDLSTERDLPLENSLYQMGYRSRLSLPLRVGEQVIGLLNLAWTHPHGYAQTQLPLLSQIADAIALAVEKNRLFLETHRRAYELEILAEISTALRIAESTTTIMEIILGRSLTIFHSERGAIAVPGPQSGILVIAHEQGWTPSLSAYTYHLDDSIFGHVFVTGQPYLAQDLTNDQLVHKSVRDAWAEATPTQSLTAMYAPLRAGAEVTGIIFIADELPRLFTENDLRLLNALAEIAGSALHRAGVLETLELRVTERTRELAAANERLKELDRLRDQFVSNVSHELRTPLTNIKLHLGLLEKRGPEALERYIPTLQRETERLRKLIEDLLDISRLRAQISELKREPLRLDPLLADIVAIHATRAENKGLSLRHDLNPAVPEVPVDRAQLIQVFTNLVGNAVAYTPSGGHVRVTSALEPRGGAAGVAIRFNNSAPVIAPEDLAHLFERFYRGKTGMDSGEPGTGLGLAICKDIVERHEGEIHAVSAEADGTTFTIWLPLHPAS